MYREHTPLLLVHFHMQVELLFRLMRIHPAVRPRLILYLQYRIQLFFNEVLPGWHSAEYFFYVFVYFSSMAAIRVT